MTRWQIDTVSTKGDDLANETIRNFRRLREKSEFIPLEVRTFVDATAGAVSKFLPDGVTSFDKDYFFAKTDASANAVTVYPYGTQTIAGAASYALAAQYNNVTLVWDSSTRVWFVK